MMMQRAVILFLLPLVALAVGADKKDSALGKEVRKVLARAPGKVCLYAKNLDSGAGYGVCPDEKVRTASTIKLPILVALFGEVEAGRARWDERLRMTAGDVISGSGVLREFSPGMEFPLRDLAHLMIVVSDNTATNLVLDRITADTVNAYMDRMGLPNTRSLRKVLGDGADLKPVPSGLSEAGKRDELKPYGIGVSTPKEMVQLLEKIERGEAISEAASKEMIAILLRQQYKDGIGRHLENARVASKSGALSALRSDVALVYTGQSRIALAITVDGMKKPDWSPDNPGLITISELAQVLVKALK